MKARYSERAAATVHRNMLLQTSTENIRERLARLMKERLPVYEHVADYIVDVDDKTPEEIAKEIVALIHE